ncbi:MAG: hypothetical protein ACC669_09350 [bacterium]
MSLWTSITKFARGAITKALPFVVPGVGGVAAGALASGLTQDPRRSSAPKTGPGRPNIPIPGQGLERLLPGGKTGYASAGKFKLGKLSGNMIPHGYVERMSKAGVIYLTKIRRRRGISGRDLQTYRRVHRVLKTYSKEHKKR